MGLFHKKDKGSKADKVDKADKKHKSPPGAPIIEELFEEPHYDTPAATGTALNGAAASIKALKGDLTAAESITDLDKRSRALLALFPTYTALYHAAEVAGDTAQTELLSKEVRGRFRLEAPPIPASTMQTIITGLRFFMVYMVVAVGGTNILLCMPLRWLHPILRYCGLPNGSLPMDVLVRSYAKCILAAGGTSIRVEGSDPGKRWKKPHEDVKNGLVVYNHSSNLDAFCLLPGVAPITPKFVMKKSILMVPFFGWICFAVGMVAVNRKNRQQAVATLNKAVDNVMRTYHRSVCIAPEGTRSKDGFLLLPFKKGAFHMQEATGTLLLPMVIHGATELMPTSANFFRPGVVIMTPADAIPFDSSRSRDDTRRLLEKTLAAGISKRPPAADFVLTTRERLVQVLVMSGCMWLFYVELTSFFSLMAYYNLGLREILGGFLAVAVGEAALVKLVI